MMGVLLCVGVFFLTAVSSFSQLAHPNNNDAFLQNEVASVYISIAPEDIETILTDSLLSDHEYPASFKYVASFFTDSVELVGFRLRGNTSRHAAKKSFKVAFNSFISGQKWNGLEKMNLNGEHNDVSIMRSRISNQLMRSAELPCSRTSYVKLFINEEYKGLYMNMEHIDDEFLQRRFIDNDEGNLYKCFWGADLTYLGSDPLNYAELYELKTNKALNDYSGLISFIEQLNNTSESEFPCVIQEIFDVELYLKTLAMEIVIGHWDGYAVNNNNYYLYQRPSDEKFVFIEYDMDNTFGIDWSGIDWANTNIYQWGENDRPLYHRIMAVPYFKDRFDFHMHQIFTSFFQSGLIVQELMATQNLISEAALMDEYKGLDYGFSNEDFENAITEAFGLHVTYSLEDFISQRIASAGMDLDSFVGLENPCELGIETYSQDPEQMEYFNLMGKKLKDLRGYRGMYIGRSKSGASINYYQP